jgi:hypothetical protein
LISDSLKMPLILGEFLVMAGSFAVLFAILLCGIRKTPDDPRSYARYKLRKQQRLDRLRKYK